MLYNLADQCVDTEVLEALDNAGLELVVTNDDMSESPREWGVDSTWVGVDVPTQVDLVGKGHNFDEYVTNYCREILNCKPHEIVWSTVYKFEHGNVAYAVSPFNCRWDSGISGFIYRTKEDIRKDYSVKRISKNLEEQIRENFKNELDAYTQWANGEVYQVGVRDKETNEFISYSYGDIYFNTNIEQEILEAIDNILHDGNKPSIEELMENNTAEA